MATALSASRLGAIAATRASKTEALWRRGIFPTFPDRLYELTSRLNKTPDRLWCTDNSASLREFDYSSPMLRALTPTIFVTSRHPT